VAQISAISVAISEVNRVDSHGHSTVTFQATAVPVVH
jgi:hypothetical protein